MSITDLLQPIKDRLNAVSEGPWEIVGGNEYLTGIDVAIGSWDDGGISLEDATFLSSAPTDQARLIAAVEAVAALAEYWESTPALRNGPAAKDLRTALTTALESAA